MITRNMLRAFVLATTCLAPLAASAADDFSVAEPASTGPSPLVDSGKGYTGSIGLGIRAVGANNANQAGRYDGLNTSGIGFGITDFNVLGRSFWNSDETRYYEFYGDNLFWNGSNRLGSGLGVDSDWVSHTNNKLANMGSVGIRFGDQGTWSANIGYDAITYTGNVIDSIYTMHGNQGFLNPGLTAFGGASATSTTGATTSFTASALQATNAMQLFQMGTRRDIISAGVKYMWNDWTIAGAFRHEHKEGSMEESFDGPWGGTAFGLPVNYDTDRYDVTATYGSRVYQALLQYTFSHFVDNNVYASLPYPTANASHPYQRAGAYSTPPSNDAHYLTMQLASNSLIPKTRLNLNARVGLEVQNDSFAPNTADPGGANLTGATLTNLNSSLVGATANTPNMAATIYQVRISANSRPLPNVDTKLYYGLDGRNVSLDTKQIATGGTGGAGADTTPGAAYISVVPQEWFKQNAGAEVGYRILPESDTKLTVGYRYDSTARSNAQVGHSSTSTATAGLSSQITSQIDGKLTFGVSDRSGSMNYLGPWAIIGQGSTYSGAYYQAPMTSESATLRADYTPSPSIATGLFVTFKNEDYHYDTPTTANGGTATSLPTAGAGGIKQDYALLIGPDFNYRPTKGIDLHAFYTYELLFYNNQGNGACSTTAQLATAACAGAVGFFQNKQTSSTHTIGLGGDWQINEKLKLRADYTLSYGSVMFGQFNGVFVATPTASYQNVTNYPDINSLMNSVKVTATYQYTPTIELALVGMYTTFHNTDWNDTANPVQANGSNGISILTPGYYAPNFSIATVMGGVRFHF
jgi:Putative outer membrane beta-barrel porin, MtrB/PioB